MNLKFIWKWGKCLRRAKKNMIKRIDSLLFKKSISKTKQNISIFMRIEYIQIWCLNLERK